MSQTMRYRLLTDRQVEGACKLYGVPFRDLAQVRGVLARSFRVRLRRYQLMRSPLGGEYGRWECVPLPPPAAAN